MQTESCTRPFFFEGYAEQIGDCDDSNSDVYPNANEVCDSLDNDCDGRVDDDDDNCWQVQPLISLKTTMEMDMVQEPHKVVVSHYQARE